MVYCVKKKNEMMTMTQLNYKVLEKMTAELS